MVARAHRTWNATWAMPSDATTTERGLAPSTRQLSDSPDSRTLWLPGLRLLSVTVPPVSTNCSVPPSTLTLKPSVSVSSPLVLTATWIWPSVETLIKVSLQPAMGVSRASAMALASRVYTGSSGAAGATCRPLAPSLTCA